MKSTNFLLWITLKILWSHRPWIHKSPSKIRSDWIKSWRRGVNNDIEFTDLIIYAQVFLPTLFKDKKEDSAELWGLMETVSASLSESRLWDRNRADGFCWNVEIKERNWEMEQRTLWLAERSPDFLPHLRKVWVNDWSEADWRESSDTVWTDWSWYIICYITSSSSLYSFQAK